MAVSTYFHGKFGVFTLGTSTIINVTGWDLTHSVQDHDTTSTASAGFGEVQGGIEMVEGSMTAKYDTTSGPYTYSFLPGTYLTNVKLANGSAAATADSTTQFTLTSCFIKSVKPKVTVDNVTEYTIEFRSHGTFTKPTK